MNEMNIMGIGPRHQCPKIVTGGTQQFLEYWQSFGKFMYNKNHKLEAFRFQFVRKKS
jgi:hypothetical protein